MDTKGMGPGGGGGGKIYSLLADFIGAYNGTKLGNFAELGTSGTTGMCG